LARKKWIVLWHGTTAGAAGNILSKGLESRMYGKEYATVTTVRKYAEPYGEKYAGGATGPALLKIAIPRHVASKYLDTCSKQPRMFGLKMPIPPRYIRLISGALPINSADAMAAAKAARERALDIVESKRRKKDASSRLNEMKQDAVKRIQDLVNKKKMPLARGRELFRQRFDPSIKNAQVKFEKALKDAGMSPEKRLAARGGAVKIGITTSDRKGNVTSVKAAVVATTKIASTKAAIKPRAAKKTNLATMGPRIISEILGREPFTILRPSTGKWEPPLMLDRKFYNATGKDVFIPRSKAAYREAELTGATYRRVRLPRARMTGRYHVPADVAKYVAQEIGEVAIKRKFKSTFQGRPSTYGGDRWVEYLDKLGKGNKPVLTAKSFQAADIAMKMVGSDVSLPAMDPSRITHVTPIRGGRNAGKILVTRWEGTTMITPGLTKYGRKPMLPFLRKESWTRRMRVKMPSNNEGWLIPGEMTPGQAASVLGRIIDSLSPGKGGRITTFGGVDVTERPGYSMLREIGEKAVASVQDAIRKRKYGYMLSPMTIAYREKMASGGHVYTEGRFGRIRRTWHDFPARRSGDIVPINRPSGKQVGVVSSPDHPLLWTGTLVNSVESIVDYNERSVSYGVFHSNPARHPVDGKMMYDIARYLLKRYNFLGHHVVREDVIKTTVDIMVDYFNKIVHGGMDIQMRGMIKVPAYLTGKERANALKMALTPKVGTIVANLEKRPDAYGRMRKEDLPHMEPVNIGYDQMKIEQRRSKRRSI